jgi:hypothetical protein
MGFLEALLTYASPEEKLRGLENHKHLVKGDAGRRDALRNWTANEIADAMLNTGEREDGHRCLSNLSIRIQPYDDRIWTLTKFILKEGNTQDKARYSVDALLRDGPTGRVLPVADFHPDTCIQVLKWLIENNKFKPNSV